ncbi:MAG: diadenylate cyclase CdaA [Candidatus Aminicenantes bacterium]|nr:diadenylate cyclase CdaA [Candidatus Aminicenantes bacterium]
MLELLKNAFRNFTLADGVDIFLVSVIFYQFIKLIKGSRAYQMTLGLFTIAIAYILSLYLKLNTLNWLFKEFLTYLIIAIIVLYQGELRKILAEIGSRGFLRPKPKRTSRETIKTIALASKYLAAQKIGALIAIEKDISLKNFAEKGVMLDALVTRDLILSIFFPTSPLHDGGMIISDDRIKAAACLFPHPTEHPFLKEYGTKTRHLAAIGMSMETDSAVVVVSEEKGTISLAIAGRLFMNLDRETLERKIVEHMERK